MEEDLGTRLFDRHQGGYALTAAGEVLATQLAPVDELIDAAQRQLGGLDAQLSGPLRITTTDTLLGPLLMPILAEFRSLHPRIQLQVVVNNSFLNLSRREADIAVRPATAPPEHLVGRLAGLLQTAPYAARSYLRQFGRGRLPHHDEAWNDYDWVVPDDALSHLPQARWVAANVRRRAARCAPTAWSPWPRPCARAWARACCSACWRTRTANWCGWPARRGAGYAALDPDASGPARQRARAGVQRFPAGEAAGVAVADACAAPACPCPA
ncbi:LysR family transcriptional regulator [Cupriavidus basilensis]